MQCQKNSLWDEVSDGDLYQNIVHKLSGHSKHGKFLEAIIQMLPWHTINAWYII